VQSNNVDMILIKNFDEIIRISDMHLSTTANLMTSPYKNYYEQQINSWKDRLELVSECIEAWLNLQNS